MMDMHLVWALCAGFFLLGAASEIVVSKYWPAAEKKMTEDVNMIRSGAKREAFKVQQAGQQIEEAAESVTGTQEAPQAAQAPQEPATAAQAPQEPATAAQAPQEPATAGQKFCTECGHDLSTSPGAKFCPACGHKLTA